MFQRLWYIYSQTVKHSSKHFNSVNSVKKTSIKSTLDYFTRFSSSAVTFKSTGQRFSKLQTVEVASRHKMVRPTGVAHNWDLRTYSPEQIKVLSHEIIEKVRTLFESVANVKDKESMSFETVLQPILQAYRLFYGYGNGMGAIVTFPLKVAESAEVRDAASEATKLFNETSVQLAMRKDIFEIMVAYQEKAQLENIDPEYKRCLEKLICDGKKNGLHLNAEIREQVSDVKSKILALQLRFGRNLIEHKSKLLFAADELVGMSTDFVEALKIDKETGKCIVTLEYPHLFPILKKCRVPSTRRQLTIANYSKCHPENTQILEELLKLRHQEATLLGYKNHASFILDGTTIAKDPNKVAAFLDDLKNKLQPLWEKEKKILLDLKADECAKYGYENNQKLEVWDVSYYSNLVEEKFYNLNQEELKPYFPLDGVTKGLLGIYEEILGLSFTFIPDAERWHDDVMMYQVDDAETEKLIGYFYLDLFPREGKYGHACWVPLQSNCPDENAARYPVIGAMLANFTRPVGDKPALLTHREVETFFHEFGHVMHGICTKAKSQLFFGTNVERDFVEAPSQMLENWVWEKEPLRRMSQHYQDKSPLPDKLIEKLASTKKVNAGAFNLRQIVFATFDQLVHQDASGDTPAKFAETLKAVQGLEAPPGTNFAAGFGHIGAEYSARYYSYLWSEVFSADMFQTNFARNLLSSETGKLYRTLILEPGGTIDGIDMVRNFLGRDPNSDAFLDSKGVELVK